jgi:glycosyltransferase involved in cell wall biosynthesis
MKKQDFGPEDLALSLVKIGNYLEGISATAGLISDPPSKYRSKIEQIRVEEDYELPYSSHDPLVTIRISSYNGSQDLIDRCLPSIFAQTYQNWEVVIVGDCDPQANVIIQYLTILGDDRIRFIQREFRGPYPEDPRQAWLISGAHAFNVASKEARGLWLAKLDQDDAWEPQHLAVLITHAQKNRSEVVYGKVRCHFLNRNHMPPQIIGEYPPKRGTFALTAALCHGKYNVFEMNELAYLWNEPGDWGLTWRLWLGGSRFDFIEEVIANIFIEQKDNSGYFESQFRILSNTISRMQSKPNYARRLIGLYGKGRSKILRILNFTKRAKNSLFPRKRNHNL